MARMDVGIRGVEAPLVVRRLKVVERLNAWFELDAIVQSYAADLDLDAAIWSPARVSLEAGWINVRDGGARSWTGLVQRIEQIGAELAGLSTYAIRIVPRLYLLTQNRLYRAYTRRTIPDIVKAILETHLIDHEWRMDPAAFPSLERRVQYGESDYVFLSRLCEEAGITWSFEDREDRGSVQVLTDDAAAVAAKDRRGTLAFESSPNEAAQAPYVTRVSISREGAPVRHEIQDYDFRRPGFALYGKAEAAETPAARLAREYYRPGAFRVDTMRPPPSGVSAPPSKGAGRNDARAGRELAARVALAEASQALTVELETNAVYLAPGEVFSIENHPHPSQGPDRWLLVTDYELEAELGKEWRARIRAVSAEHPYKPQQKTPRPIVNGIQSAIVVGLDHTTVFVDEHGRVKVRFLWEKLGEGEEPYDTTWTRVSQLFTGPGSGIWRIPRIGEEVAVGFFEGNPDEPLILSGIPNAYTPSPYALPEHALKTVWRTRSEGDDDGYTEISMDDRRGQEKLYERAQGVKETHVKKDLSELVEGNRKRAVGGAEEVAIKGERRDQVDGDVHSVVGGEYRRYIGGRASLVFGGDLHIVVRGSLTLDVIGDLSQRTAGKLVQEAKDASVVAPGAFLRLHSGGVMMNPPDVQGGAPAAAAAASPEAPLSPNMPIAYRSNLPAARLRLPVLGQIFTSPQFGEPWQTVVCATVCDCAKQSENNARLGLRRRTQVCVTERLRAYDRALDYQSKIKAEVRFDTDGPVAVPYMDKDVPLKPYQGTPKFSDIPDLVIVRDPKLPPIPPNIERVIDFKFEEDVFTANQITDYPKIAPGVPVEEWGTDYPCYCKEREEEEEKERVKGEAIGLILLAIVLIADDLAGGFADDPALIPIIARLAALGF